ncbi:MAG: M48 family metalloprotease [Alphaproteobacteria bacterium]
MSFPILRHARSILAGAAVSLLALAGPAFADGGQIRDAEIEQTLRDFATPIWKAANLEPSSVSIYILNDPELNAFVTEGQNVFLHTGLILAADSPNQLKGVIAHETGHISGGHLARSDENMGKAMRPAIISIGLGILALAAGAPDAGAALISGSQQFAMASYVRFSQVQEASADQAGMSFMEASGQSGEGLLQFFEKFRYEEVMSDARRQAYFRTHPLSADRIQALRVRVESAPHRDAKDSESDITRFKMMQAKLYGFLETPARTFVKYPLTDNSPPARYARAVADYRIPDTGKAVKEIEALVQTDPNNPYFQELWGQVLFESGKAREAVPHDRLALKLRPDSALLQINLARSLNGVGDEASAKEAIGILQKAVAIESDNAFAWREMAIAYDTTQNEGMARLASAEQSFSLGDYAQALNFAQRAKKTLPEGTASWRRASDIVLVSENETRQKRRG